MARPPKVSDEQVFSCALDIVLEDGVEKFRFEKLASKLNVRRSTLTNRFKSKLELLRRADAHYLSESKSILHQVTDSPIATIVALLSGEMRFATSVKRYTNGLGLLAVCLKDEQMHAAYRRAFLNQKHEITALLERAKNQSSITSDTDCQALARHLQAVQQGASHLWLMRQDGTITECISAQLYEALQPYRASSELQ